MLDLEFLNLAETELDRNIYRIMREEHVLTLFQNRENVLSQIGNWKDKFENFQLNIGGILNGRAFTYGMRDAFVGQCWTLESMSEAMWGIYANDPQVRYLRIRSTPRKLLTALAEAHSEGLKQRCFVGKVRYLREDELRATVQNGGQLALGGRWFASNLLLKRRAFRHESEVRLLFFGDTNDYGADSLYRYKIDPHTMISQIMADPNRDRSNWVGERSAIREATGFTGSIMRSKIYDPPDWDLPIYSS